MRFLDSYHKELAQMYGRKRELLYDALVKAGFKCRKSGAYYILADIPHGVKMDDMEFARYMVHKVGVAAVHGSSFFKGEAGKHKLLN